MKNKYVLHSFVEGIPLAPYVSQDVGKNCDLLVLSRTAEETSAETFINCKVSFTLQTQADTGVGPDQTTLSVNK